MSFTKPCVGCGECCKKVLCGFGRPDPSGGCRYQVPWKDDNLPMTRYRCGVYDDIVDSPGADVSPAFGAGCCQPLENTARGQIVSALVARGRWPQDSA